MRALALAVALVALSLPACGPSFKSESEELAYLKALSNPTADQWKRRNELTKKAADELAAWDAKQRIAGEVAEMKAVLEREEREAKERPAMLARAAQLRADGKPLVAANVARNVMEKWPGTSEAIAAAKLADECEAESRAKYEAEQAAEKAARSRTAVGKLMDEARAYEAKGEPGLAYRSYREIVEKHPDEPEAPDADFRMRNCYRKAYPGLPFQ